ncbi:hypothetical protein BS50DRAFT_571237 [Corynespora cassiicola Philippines]|uniref:Uncharacterized protein n=1 Tax=Corynespora cassiicola Philippines TaxID=1448308 RepID=A0A2T2NWW1_CORCC|nr:hypothetical protein BS50DRAFT_571237 [Corynespora cassiicola Philippines]
MVLKRKRSVDESPLSLSSFGGFASTPEAQSPAHGFDNPMDVDAPPTLHSSRFTWDFANATRTKGSDWGLRTRKRFRDNRPDERAIHANTLQKLFAAQRDHLDASPTSADEPVPQPAPVVEKVQKSTLHSFWKLPAPPVQPPQLQAQRQAQPQCHGPKCEDCDAPLEDAVDGMEIDGGMAESPSACNECGRSVCSTCAVVSNARLCLQCATSSHQSRRWW